MKFHSRRFSVAVLVASMAVGVSAPLRAEPSVSSELDAETLYDALLGEMAVQRGQMGVAAEALGRAAQRTRDERFAERATLAALAGKQFTDAERASRLWIELNPTNMEAREALAAVLLELDRTPEATEQLAIVLDDPASRASLDAVYLRVAAVLGRVVNRSAAFALMQDLVKRHAEVPGAHFVLAHLAVRAGDLEAAEAAVDRALALKSDWQDAALFKGRILVSRNQPAQAQRYFEDFLKTHPSASHVRLHFARYLLDQKQWDQAREQFKRVAKDAPEDGDAAFAVGMLAFQTNHFDEAEKYLKRTIELRPESDQARIFLGQLAEQTKRLAEARRWYQDVSQGEYYFEAQLRLGMTIAKQGDVAKARAHLRAIPIENEQQQVQMILAEEQVLRDARQYSAALEMLNAALVQLPGDKDLLYSRALVAERLDMLALVESDLRAVLAVDPKHVNALNALGYTLADRTERYTEAQALLAQALEIKPDDPFVLDSMGWLLYRQGSRDEAIKYLKRALGLRGDAEIAAHLGEVLWVSGDRKEAESVWKRALRDTPDNEALRDVIKKFKP